jgi:hypothetical protein
VLVLILFFLRGATAAQDEDMVLQASPWAGCFEAAAGSQPSNQVDTQA